MKGGALVTGAGHRIGRAIATHLGGLGYRVAVHYNSSADAAEEVAALIQGEGGQATAVQADLMDEGDLGALVGKAAAALDAPLTVLVNNASLFEKDDIASVTADSWGDQMQVNLRAPLELSRTFAEVLPAGTEGNIINLIDQRVWRLTPDFLSYTISKSGLWALTQTLAQALAPQIRVNGIGPGPVLRSKHQDAEMFAEEARSVPLQRGATPEEISRAVKFILDSPSITGQMIALDGGQHLG